MSDVQEHLTQNQPQDQGPGPDESASNSGATSTDNRSSEQKKQDAELAERLSSLIEDANRRVVPLCKMIRQVSFSIPLPFLVSPNRY
jgi:hypothetical protein